MEIHGVSMDPRAPTVNGIIDRTFISGVQIDNGLSVNLMNYKTMEELGLTSMIPTPIILRMANQSRVKSMGMLSQILTTIGGLDYKIDYIVLKLTESISSYPILLGRPWLYLAKAKDWGKETLIIGKGENQIVLPLYPSNYHGETQEEETSITSEIQSETRSEESEIEPIQKVNKELLYKNMGLDQYFIPLAHVDDSDDAILAWENLEVLNIEIESTTDLEPEI